MTMSMYSSITPDEYHNEEDVFGKLPLLLLLLMMLRLLLLLLLLLLLIRLLLLLLVLLLLYLIIFLGNETQKAKIKLILENDMAQILQE